MTPLSVADGSWRVWFRYGGVGLVAGIVLSTILSGLGAPQLVAQAGALGGHGQDSLIAFTTETPGNPNGSLLYLIDTKTQAFAIYRVDSLRGTVRLEAARQFRSDLRLSEYNNQSPTVAAVEAMVAPPRGASGSREP